MKKNKMMRIASVLLVAVLLSTCAISGTFAKYVTTGTASDVARVAKWGVTIEGAIGGANNMFTDSYKNTPATYTANEDGDTITVQASTAGTAIVAPGTESTLTAFDISGQPEVDVVVTYVADLELEGWDVMWDWDNNPETDKTSGFYCPIVFTVKANGTTTTIQMDETNTTAELLEKAVEDAIVNAKANYDTNEDLANVEDDLVVSWKWNYEGEDGKDTLLGDAAANANGNAATINLKVDVTITQVN